jgi:multicomponent Na+:H+ antiporter subunit E
MKRMLSKGIVILSRAAMLGGIWVVLTGADPKGLIVGAVAVPAAIWLSLRLIPARRPVHVWRLALHLPAFVAGSVLGGLDVARRALAAHRPLNPGWVEVPARLPDGGRVLMGAGLSLMPGTLAAGMRGDRLLVHLLDTEAGFERTIPREETAIAAMMPGDAAEARTR